MSFHASLTTSDGIHSPIAWVWADATARTAQSVAAEDLNKIGLQTDTGVVYRLDTLTPTWVAFGGTTVSDLDDLADVSVAAPNDRGILTYDSGSGNWVSVDGLVSGTTNTITNSQDSVILGGATNTIDDPLTTGNNAIVGGEDNTIQDCNYTAVIACEGVEPTGISNGLGASSAFTTLTADFTTAVSSENSAASAKYGVVLGGAYANADKPNQIVAASSEGAALGDIQGTIQITGTTQITHSTAAWSEVSIDGGGTQITLATDALVAFTILLIGATAGQAKRMVYKIEGAISNDGGTTTLLASTVTTIYEDDVSFDARVQANDTTDALVIEVQDTDAASDTVLWAYTYRSVEIIF